MLTKLFINKPVFSIQHYINKPLSGSISQHSGKSYALLKSCKSPLLLPIAQIKNTLLPPWHPLLIFKGECIRWHRRFEVLNFVGFFFWLHWIFVAVRGLSLGASGGYSSLQCAGFSLRWLLLLQSTGSRRMGFSSCGTWAQ